VGLWNQLGCWLTKTQHSDLHGPLTGKDLRVVGEKDLDKLLKTLLGPLSEKDLRVAREKT
jgi:hypothetical protein